MPLKTISAARLAAGRLWAPELTFDFMYRAWQGFEVPFDFAKSTVGPIGPCVAAAYDPVTTTFNVYPVWPESWDTDSNFADGMVVQLTLYFYLTCDSGSTRVYFTNDGGTTGVLSNTGPGVFPKHAWRYTTKSYTTPLPTGQQTESMTLQVNQNPQDQGTEGGELERDFGSGNENYLRVVMPDIEGVDTDDAVLYIGDESELPTPSSTWRGVRAYLKAPTGVAEQDKQWYCMKGYDDAYYWVPLIQGGGGL